jgi:hypothetical protein
MTLPFRTGKVSSLINDVAQFIVLCSA